MSSESTEDQGPDLAAGVPLSAFDGRPMLRGHVGEDSVLLAQVGNEVLAVGASCTHYGGPLEEGNLEGDTVRCPWHHACFSLRTGEAIAAPAFDSLPCWHVERDGDRVRVLVRKEAGSGQNESPQKASPAQPANIVIVGGGAAGFACAEMLRRHGYSGTLTMLSDDESAPVDRPNLSKDYLAGNAPEEWIPLRPDDFYSGQKIDLHLATTVDRVDVASRNVFTADGRVFPWDRLLLATGAEPIRLPIPGSEQEHVRTLRSLSDTRALIEKTGPAKSAVVLGSGFIGLEVAASLRARGLEVHVVSLDATPLQAVMGPDVGAYIRSLHEAHGVHFHMATSIAEIGKSDATLRDGSKLSADIVVIGIGVRPRTQLAAAAGLSVDKGVLVNDRLETSVPGVYAAGDIARWHASGSDETHRIEHWVVAERQGQVVAENMLGGSVSYNDAPFFWSAHYDTTIRYAGIGMGWDDTRILGDLSAGDCEVQYLREGKVIAVATIGRDSRALEFAAQWAAV